MSSGAFLVPGLNWSYNQEYWHCWTTPCFNPATIRVTWTGMGHVTFRSQIEAYCNGAKQLVCENHASLEKAKRAVHDYCDREQYWHEIAQHQIDYMRKACGDKFEKSAAYQSAFKKWSPLLPSGLTLVRKGEKA